VNILNDRALRDLLLSGCPNIELPSRFTISRDIRASFEKCQERIGKLLQVCDQISVNVTRVSSCIQEHAGCLHFATDAWTSLNHRAFIAWTVHLEHEGEMISFLLDIIEVAEVSIYFRHRSNFLIIVIQSHTGEAIIR